MTDDAWEQLTPKEVITMKKSYKKPEVAEVKLAAEEAVLNNCKIQPPAGDPPGPCNPNFDPLVTLGS